MYHLLANNRMQIFPWIKKEIKMQVAHLKKTTTPHKITWIKRLSHLWKLNEDNETYIFTVLNENPYITATFVFIRSEYLGPWHNLPRDMQTAVDYIFTYLIMSMLGPYFVLHNNLLISINQHRTFEKKHWFLKGHGINHSTHHDTRQSSSFVCKILCHIT